jgi:hypothetical protein
MLLYRDGWGVNPGAQNRPPPSPLSGIAAWSWRLEAVSPSAPIRSVRDIVDPRQAAFALCPRLRGPLHQNGAVATTCFSRKSSSSEVRVNRMRALMRALIEIRSSELRGRLL